MEKKYIWADQYSEFYVAVSELIDATHKLHDNRKDKTFDNFDAARVKVMKLFNNQLTINQLAAEKKLDNRQ